MTHHQRAWRHVREHLFGRTLEVTTKPHWGFKGIAEHQTIDEFLAGGEFFDTIVLHILAGEGTSINRVVEVIEAAYPRCLKLVILEHNPDQFPDVSPAVNAMGGVLESHGELVIHKNWGRNQLWACTTVTPLHLPQLSDEYYRKHIGQRWVTRNDKGIDPRLLVYTHTSESPVKEIPAEGDIWWTIGGGLAFEAIAKDKQRRHVLFDATLMQCIFARCLMGGLSGDKIQSLSGIDAHGIGSVIADAMADPHQEQNGNPRHWRCVMGDAADAKPFVTSIRHMPAADAPEGVPVYVSTIPKRSWPKNNPLIESITERDRPRWRPLKAASSPSSPAATITHLKSL